MNHCSMRSLAGFWILLLGWPALFHAASVSSPVSPEDEVLAESIQSFYGLKVTGALNNETLPVMKRPRCGLLVVRRYVFYDGRPKWGKKLITYRITNYTSDLAQETVDATIAQAFQLYSDVIPLDFRQIHSGTADIEMFFVAKEHADGYNFDGKGRTMAHAQRPRKAQGGFVHFDEDETWTVSEKEANLLLVAAHEIGHSLGLDHTQDNSTLMYEEYNYFDTKGYKLPDNERRGVQALYGKKTSIQQFILILGSRQPVEPSPEDEQCNRTLVFDAATSFRGDLVFFKNGYYWRKCSKDIYFTNVNTKWSEIYIVDAAYEVPHKNVVYLFEGAQYWGIKADSETVMSGYPQPLTNLGLPPSVTHVDAAVYESTTKKTFIFSGSQYWRYDDGSNEMDPEYPRDIKKDFPGIGSKVDAAFENRGNLFLSNGPRQSEYNTACRKVIRVLLNYGWLECY
ncbi:collagenase 3-like [Cheilinus undulatus]|uniref:collagenase 3-like n=1 Tax=Cheilinus undulatus TaxID=241271 RepID=UPI001BD5914F|nr:collagenase 3-like [Cheilinus undulatus]